MDRAGYIAMTGAKHAMESQQHTSHNLANADTPGFRGDFAQLMQNPVDGPGHPSRAFASETSIGHDFASGPMMTTGNPLDVAIQGDGMFAVDDEDGEAYTRRGDFRAGANGLLENGAGEVVLGEQGPIAIPPAESVTIGEDGTVSFVPEGQDGQNQAVIDRIRLVNPDTNNLEKGSDGLFRTINGENAPMDAQIRVSEGMLEGSNVSTIDAMVEMIDSQRNFEMQTRMLSQLDENGEAGSQLLRR